MQGEKPGRGQEGERDVKQPRIPSPDSRLACRVRQNGGDNCRTQYQPEVRRMVLQSNIEVWPPKQQS